MKIQSVTILEKKNDKISKISLKYFRKPAIIIEDTELIAGIMLMWVGQIISKSLK